jgi:hypothetical protein
LLLYLRSKLKLHRAGIILSHEPRRGRSPPRAC